MFFKNSLRNTFCTNLLVEGVLYLSEHVVCRSNISIVACNHEHHFNFEKARSHTLSLIRVISNDFVIEIFLKQAVRRNYESNVLKISDK